MKNRTLNRILLPLVLLIWVGVLYRIFAPKGGEEQLFKDNPSLISQAQLTKGFTAHPLFLDYQDPFLLKPFRQSGNQQVSTERTTLRTTPQVKIPEKPKHPSKIPIDLSRYGYLGQSHSREGNGQVVVIQFADEVYYVGLGDSIGAGLLTAIQPDSIKITFADTVYVLPWAGLSPTQN